MSKSFRSFSQVGTLNRRQAYIPFTDGKTLLKAEGIERFAKRDRTASNEQTTL